MAVEKKDLTLGIGILVLVMGVIAIMVYLFIPMGGDDGTQGPANLAMGGGGSGSGGTTLPPAELRLSISTLPRNVSSTAMAFAGTYTLKRQGTEKAFIQGSGNFNARGVPTTHYIKWNDDRQQYEMFEPGTVSNPPGIILDGGSVSFLALGMYTRCTDCSLVGSQDLAEAK